MLLFVQMLLFSIPRFRTKFHNTWEQTHRFVGWLLLVCFWTHLIIYNIYQSERSTKQPVGKIFYASLGFYLLVISTLSVILPWLSLRKVTPQIERLSRHAVRLHFNYANVKRMQNAQIRHRSSLRMALFCEHTKPSHQRILHRRLKGWRLDGQHH